MIRLLAQIEPDFVPPAGSTDTGGGSSPAGLVLIVLVLGVALFLWRRRAGRRSAAALERVAEAVDPSAPGGRYPRPPALRWDHGGDRVAQATAFVAAIHRRCIGCGREEGIRGPSRPLVDICARCDGRLRLIHGDGNGEVAL